MNERLEKYFDSLFEGAPDTKEIGELKEEIFTNTLDRYNDLISQGKSEDASFTQAVARIGDIDELISLCNIDRTAEERNYYSEEEKEANERKRKKLLYASMGIFIVSVLPPVALFGTLGVTLMFLLIGAAAGMLTYAVKSRLDPEKASRVIDVMKKKKGDSFTKKVFETKRKTDSLLISAAVTLFVYSFIPPAIHAVSPHQRRLIPVLTMLLLCASVAAVIFYKFNKVDMDAAYSNNMVEEFKEWNRRNSSKVSYRRIFNIALTLVSVFVFVLFVMETGDMITLLPIFLLDLIVIKFVKNLIDYRKLVRK